MFLGLTDKWLIKKDLEESDHNLMEEGFDSR
jgi:hypothetical protein